MSNEIDLELYTIGITRLNNGFQNIGLIIQNNAQELHEGNLEAIKILTQEIENRVPSFEASANDFEKIYLDTVNGLNQSEVNYNEYEVFFKYINQIFPQYQESLKKSIDNLKNIGIENKNLKNAIKKLDCEIAKIITVFDNLLKIANSYCSKK